MPAVPVQQAFDLALQHHQAGRLAEAEALYRQVLAVQPNHADALHFLGVIAHQAGRHDLAIELISQAVVLDPNNPAAHSNLGEAYRANACLEKAIVSYRRAMEINPDDPGPYYNLGLVFLAQGRLEEAVRMCRRAVELNPASAEGYIYLGNALRSHSQLDEAVSAYRRALEVDSRNADAYNNLGVALAEQRQFEDAILAYREALRLAPEDAVASYNLGNALSEQGRYDQAISAYGRALALKPDLFEVCNNRGNALSEQGRYDEAISAYRRALALKPDYAQAHYNLGNMLRDQGRLDEAVTAYRRALELKPDFAEAYKIYNNLGGALKDQGLLDEAIATIRHGLRLNPDSAERQSNLIYLLHFHPSPEPGRMVEEQQRWNRQFGGLHSRFVLRSASDRRPDRRLRIGYVSPDLREHVVGRNLLPLFRCHDRLDFEILCYSGVGKPDRLTEELRQNSQQWRDTARVSDDALAEMICRDGVDILVDLTQHMDGNRLPLFARKPAPVQVSFAGYPESTGVETIGYRISDRHLEISPPQSAIGNRQLKIPPEQVLLIDSFWCYDPCGVKIEVNGLPAQETGTVTFGSLNNFCKVNDPVLKLWARVLGSVKGSRLILLSHPGSHRRRTEEFLEREGIKAGRIEFVAPRPHHEYLELYHRLDIALDPFPYNGHTTSLDALWMGVPVVSLAGERAVSRAGLSQLANLGLPELVAHSEDAYVAIAAQLAHDLPRLTGLRATLRPRMEASVLMDAPRFARQIEAAYRTMWRQW